MRKTKNQQRNWWKSLSPKEQDKYIGKKADEKLFRNKKKSIKLMKKMGISFDCKACFHGITKNCTDMSKIGCPYFYDAIEDKFGPGYAA